MATVLWICLTLLDPTLENDQDGKFCYVDLSQLKKNLSKKENEEKIGDSKHENFQVIFLCWKGEKWGTAGGGSEVRCFALVL